MMDADRIRSRLLLWRHFLRVLHLAARQRGRVYYLEDGRIREEGAHAQLLALGGRYAEFYALHHAPQHAGETNAT